LLSGFMGYSIMQTNQRLMNYLNAVSTGVILAAAFTHLLPDAVEDLQGFAYPVAEACSLAGFLLLVLVEASMQYIQYEADHKVAATMHSKHDCAEHDFGAGAGAVHETSALQSSSISRFQSSFSMDVDCGVCEQPIQVRNTSPHDKFFGRTSSKDDKATKYGAVDSGSGHSHDAHGHSHDAHEHGSESADVMEVTPLVLGGAQDGHSHGHSHGHHPGKGMKITQTGAYTLWAALMVHSTLEGFGVGVASSVQQGAIVFAILIHKGFESLALNSALLEGNVPYPMYLLLYGIFCMSIPVGAISGALLKSNGNSVFSGIITGLASGSFM
jgi:zinc transporter ZupT